MTDGFIPPHGGYAHLLSYRKAEVVYDATVHFYDRSFDRRDRTRDGSRLSPRPCSGQALLVSRGSLCSSGAFGPA